MDSNSQHCCHANKFFNEAKYGGNIVLKDFIEISSDVHQISKSFIDQKCK